MSETAQTRPLRVAPTWVVNAKNEDQRLARLTRWIVHECAAWYHPSGTVRALSQGIGLGARTLGSYIAQRKPLTTTLAIRLETSLGRHIVRREDIRPDIFLSDEKGPLA
jgi:hypothetical protein